MQADLLASIARTHVRSAEPLILLIYLINSFGNSINSISLRKDFYLNVSVTFKNQFCRSFAKLDFLDFIKVFLKQKCQKQQRKKLNLSF